MPPTGYWTETAAGSVCSGGPALEVIIDEVAIRRLAAPPGTDNQLTSA
jgi:hypothetical protein